MSFYYFYVLALLVIAAPAALAHHLDDAPVRVVVLTTSYPRDADDVAGTFVRDGVEALRAAGRRGSRRLARRASATTGSPTATGSSTTSARAPWKVLALPLFLPRVRARGAAGGARRRRRPRALAARRALPALATGKPFVLQLWGSDVALARRVRPLARWLVRRARVVVCASTRARRRRARARRARRARDPERRRDPGDGRRAGRAAARPLRRPPLGGEGRARARRGGATACRSSSSATGRCARCSRRRSASCRRASSARTTSAPRSSSSRRAARATAWSRARRWRTAGRWSRRAVGGLVDAVEDGVTGLLVPPGDVVALRRALEELLADGTRRSDLGSAARAFAQATLGGTATGEALRAAYRDALRRHDESPSANRSPRRGCDSASLAALGFFLATFLLGALWALATPMMGSPDEPAHVVRAASVARGQWIGTSTSRAGRVASLRVPETLVWPVVPCYAHRDTTTPACEVPPDGARRRARRRPEPGCALQPGLLRDRRPADPRRAGEVDRLRHAVPHGGDGRRPAHARGDRPPRGGREPLGLRGPRLRR